MGLAPYGRPVFADLIKDKLIHIHEDDIEKYAGFESVWIQLTSGDVGGSLGAALYYLHNTLRHIRNADSGDSMQGNVTSINLHR